MGGATSSQEAQAETPPTPAMAIGFILFGAVLLFGAFYQVVRGKWFPLFPIQIDGIFGIFKDAFGLNAGIYASSLLAGVLGLALLGLGVAVLGRRSG
ncbi:MAG: hypothetical protein IE917_03995 [Betaproteobacteria bacterium]|nr:hypothetical protein [Betaproteobacteria bacterium]